MAYTDQKAEKYLNSIVGTPLQYGFKHSDFDLFQLGFGDCVSFETWKGRALAINRYAIHFDSAICLYWRNGRIDIFDADTADNVFASVISKLIGLRVKRIALSEKNDLWIDLGECRLVVVTRDDCEESWRFFQPRTENPHLIASNVALMLEKN